MKEKNTHLVIWRHRNWEYDVVPSSPWARSGFYCTVEFEGTKAQCDAYLAKLKAGI